MIPSAHNVWIRKSFQTAAALLLAATLSHCGSSGVGGGDFNPGYGPFDEQGNYVESEADKPAKTHWWQSKSKKPSIASQKKAEAEAKALASSQAAAKQKALAKAKADSAARAAQTQANARAQAQVNARALEQANARAAQEAQRPTYTPTPVTKPVVVSQPRPTYTAPKPTYTAPKPVAKKPTPKPKPTVKVTPKKKAPVRHTVRKSDTLYGLSKRYGTSVSAIQRANGLRGNTIMTGSSLLIPR